MAEFKKKAARLVAAMNATRSVLSEMGGELDVFRASAKAMPIQESLQLLKEIDELEKELEAINIAMNGDPNLGRLDMDGDYDMRQRAQSAAYDIYGSLSDVTGTSIKNYEIAADEFTPILTSVRALQSRMEAMHRKLGSRNSPWLAGALPNWSK